MRRQTIYILGYPKSGTTWLSRLLGDTLNSPVGAIRPQGDNKAIATEGQDRPGPYYVRQGHAVPVEHGDTLTPGRHEFAYKHLKDEKVVILIRDPRDIAVSAAHHWDRDLTTTIKCMGEGLWPIPHGGGWCQWVERWMTLRGGWTVTYEALRKQTYQTLEIVIKSKLKIACDNACILDAIERQSFASRKAWTKQHGDKLNYGKEFQLRFLRKGIVGDWRNHFTLEQREMAERYFGDTMRELGYVKNKDWINESDSVD